MVESDNIAKSVPLLWEDAYISNTYDFIDKINASKGTFLVMNKIDKKSYVLKQLKHFDEKIYKIIQNQKIKGVPRIYEIYHSNAGDEKSLVIIEEYINAKSLTEYAAENIISEAFLFEVINAVSDILERLQKNIPPIIHRDIKPDNILVKDNQEILLIDFNISRNYTGIKSKDTVIMGTAGFAAPEQFGFGESDIRTDIYGLGATIKYIAEEKNVNSEKLKQFTDKCLKLNPDERFQTINEVKKYILNGRITDNKSYIIPGFRNNNPLHMLGAFLFYAVVIYSAVNYETGRFVSEHHDFEIYLNKIGFVVSFLLAFWFSCNYCNWQNSIKWLRRQKGISKITGVIFIDIIIVLAVAATVALISLAASFI